MFKKLKSLFKKKPKKPAEKAKPIQAGPPKSEKVLAGKPSVKRPSVKKKDLRKVYKILKEPHVSEKATILAEKNKYIFKIYPKANKTEVRKAVENLYGVKVKDVNIINIHRKQRILRGIKGFKTGCKKAVVTLKKGEKIEIIPR